MMIEEQPGLHDMITPAEMRAKIAAGPISDYLKNYDRENDPDDLRGGVEPYSGGCLMCHQMDETCPNCEDERALC